MRQLSLFAEPKKQKKLAKTLTVDPDPKPPDIENYFTFLGGINRHLLRSLLPLRVYSVHSELTEGLNYRFWYLDTDKPILGIFTEQEVLDLANMFLEKTTPNDWRYMQDPESGKWMINRAPIILRMIEDRVYPEHYHLDLARKNPLVYYRHLFRSES